MSYLANNLNGTGGSWIVKNAPTGAPNLRAAHTICQRVRFTSVTTGDARFAMNWGPTGAAGGSMFGRYSGAGATDWNAVRHADFTAANSDQAITAGYANTTTWVHIAMTYDATNIRSYLNGVLANTTASLTTRTTNTAGSGTSMIVAGAFQGHVADVAVFDRVLTEAEILLLANGRNLPNIIGGGNCWGFWPMLFDSGATDFSGHGNNLVAETNTGAAPTINNEGPPIPWARARVLPAVYLLGTNVAIDADGDTQTTGAATVTKAASIPAAGTTQTTGAVSVTKGAPLASSGLTQTTGAASVTSSASAASSGLTQTTGVAAVTASAPVASSGTTQTTGVATVAITATYDITAAGTTQTSGAAAFAGPLTATGTTQTTGAASLTATYAITATGLTQTSGTAALSGGGGGGPGVATRKNPGARRATIVYGTRRPMR